MKKQLSSIDLHFLLHELQLLKNSRVDKVYHPEKNLIVFSFYKSNQGKKLLTINIGQSLFLSDEKEGYGETLGFGMLLRKHLDCYFLFNIGQVEPERILKLSFKVKDSSKIVYIELFGKGNVILCDENDIIINALEHHEFKDREIRPKIKYKYPIMKYNAFDLSKKDLLELFKDSRKDSIVICLATELGLGGIYSEEICILCSIDKNTNPKNIDDKQVQSILDNIKKIISSKIDAKVILENESMLDVVPFELGYYQKYQSKQFPTFSESLSFFYSNFREAKESEFDKKLGSLQRIIEEQKQTIEKLKEEEIELRAKGELIYHKYNLIKEILDEVNKASKKYSWKEIKEKLKGHEIIKDINEKERKVIIEI